MNKTPITRDRVEVYDALLRYHVPSRTPGEPPYLVDLTSYGENGVCQCKHFVCRLEPLLKQRMTPRVALESGLAEVPEWGTMEDALRCFHIHAARLRFADDVIHAINKRTNEHGPKERTPSQDADQKQPHPDPGALPRESVPHE